MGIFSTKRKTYVSSSVWNMAGDVNKRPNFLKTVIFNHMINESPSIAESLVGSYLEGPGIRLRRFSGWSINNFDAEVGTVQGGFMVRKDADPDAVAAEIGRMEGIAADQSVRLQTLNIGSADYTFWAEKYMLENHPDLVNQDWKVDFDGTTKVMKVTLPNGTVENVTLTDYDERGEYLYAVYQVNKSSWMEDPVWQEGAYINPDDPWPDMPGYQPESSNVIPKSQPVTTKYTTWYTFSDGRPQEGPWTSESTETKTWEDFDKVFYKDTYKGTDPSNPGRTYTERSRYKIHQDGIVNPYTNTQEIPEDIGGGVIRTNHIVTESASLWMNKFWERTTQKIFDTDRGPLKMLIYKSGSGNAVLDPMFGRQEAVQSFLPFIPFRIENKFLSNNYMGTTYLKSKKAFKKAIGGEYSDVMKELKKNQDIGDIDYIYAVFGVSLNTPSQTGRKYIYRFFSELLSNGVIPPSSNIDYDQWVAEREAQEQKIILWNAWKVAQSDPSNPLYGQPEPPRPSLVGSPPNSLRVYSKAKPVMNFDYTVQWSGIREDIVNGMAFPDLKVGQYRIVANQPSFETGGSIWGSLEIPLDPTGMGVTRIYWQENAARHRIITIIGLDSKNMIDNGKAVEISAKEAMDDQEESGFLIPIQMDTFKRLSLKDQTQLSTSNTYIVCNAYQVVKKRWYQRGAFQIVLIIIVIVITIVTYGGGAAAAGGILGSNAAVGAALGIAAGTMAAVIVGAIANAIAAALVMRIIQYGADKLIGGKLGKIIGAIVAVVAIAVGTGMANGQSFASSLGSMARADNLLKLTQAGVGAYSDYINASTMEYINKTNQLVADYKAESKMVSDAWADTFGTDRAFIDPTSITESFGVTMEDVNTFLNRTTMNGQDIAELSLDMVTDFVSASLQLDLPNNS